MEGLVILLIYGVIGAVLIALAILLYARSVASRKRYTCPQCGEQQGVELMEASRCSSCGAPLERPR